MNKCLLSIVVIAAMSWSEVARCSDPFFADELIPGPYAVGYKVCYLTDSSRTFEPNHDSTGSVNNRILWRKLPISIWYPATEREESARISYAQYFISVTDNPDYEQVSDLTDSVVEKMMRDQTSSEQTNVNHRRLRDVLASKLEVYLEAAPDTSLFPLILGAPGAWNPASDNSVLYEYLASHGYVVVASPSIGFSAEVMSLSWEGVEAQARDLEFLASSISRITAADKSRIGIVGFSWGVMAAITCAQRSHMIDAVVSIDGSATLTHRIELLESFPFLDPLNYTTPTLFILAHSNDILMHNLSFFDGLKYADASVFRLSSNTHGECTSYGINVFSRTSNTADDLYLDQIKTGYETICKLTLDYLNRYVGLYQQQNGREEPFVLPDYPACHLIASKRGLPKPPMHQAFFSILSTNGISRTREIFDDAISLDSAAVLFWEDDINQLGLRTIEAGNPIDAIQILSMAIITYPESFDAYYFRSYAYFVADQPDSAIADLSRALEINPNHLEARERLNALTH